MSGSRYIYLLDRIYLLFHFWIRIYHLIAIFILNWTSTSFRICWLGLSRWYGLARLNRLSGACLSTDILMVWKNTVNFLSLWCISLDTDINDGHSGLALNMVSMFYYFSLPCLNTKAENFVTLFYITAVFLYLLNLCFLKWRLTVSSLCCWRYIYSDIIFKLLVSVYGQIVECYPLFWSLDSRLIGFFFFLICRLSGHWEMLLVTPLGAAILFSVMVPYFHCWHSWTSMPSFLCWGMPLGHYQISVGASRSHLLSRLVHGSCVKRLTL